MTSPVFGYLSISNTLSDENRKTSNIFFGNNPRFKAIYYSPDKAFMDYYFIVIRLKFFLVLPIVHLQGRELTRISGKKMSKYFIDDEDERDEDESFFTPARDEDEEVICQWCNGSGQDFRNIERPCLECLPNRRK